MKSETLQKIKKQLRNVFAVVFVMAVVTACTTPTGNVTPEVVDYTEQVNPTPPIVSSVLIDISTSTVDKINVPDSAQLMELYDMVSDNPANVISLGNIGYPVSSDKQFIRFSKLEIPLKNVNNGTMTQRKNAMEFNSKAKYVNEKKRCQFIQTFNSMSAKNEEETDINTALQRAIRFFNEPTFKNHKKVLILISDGYQYTKTSREINVDFASLTDIHVILVGWKISTAGFKNLPPSKISVFEGFYNVPEYISNILKPNHYASK
ncbi:MAG: vWA domain-containing protein [Candidatus Thorarchaeota archaeon]